MKIPVRTAVTTALVLSLAAAALGIPGEAARAVSNAPPTIVDLAVQAGLYQITRTWSANIGDVNVDGQPDVFLVRHGDDTSQLFVNQGGRFFEVAKGNFPLRDRHDCAWGDVNQDGRPDLYCSIGGDSGGGVGKKELWIQHAGGPFTNEASAYGVEDPYGRGRRSTFIDVNHDAYPDLFAGNTYPRSDGRLSPNRLFINQGGTSYRNATEYGLDKEVGAKCAQAADYDQDGWQDLLVCGNEALKLYRNSNGTQFVDVTAAAGISGFSPGAVLIDVNGDGRRDLARAQQTTITVQLWSSGKFQAPVTVASGLSRGVWISAGDVDGDDDADLYWVAGCPSNLSSNKPDVMLLNSGNGTTYTRPTIPQTTQGCGDNAEPIDSNADGHVEFLVLNGIQQSQDHTVRPKGPIQLLTYLDSTEVTIDEFSFDPATASTHRGVLTNWTNSGSSTHTVADSSGMGLFSSGNIAPGGAYSFRFTAAGSYAYRCTLHSSMTGTVQVPIGAAPAVGTATTAFTVQWASAAPPSGYVFDVQVKVPGGSFVQWSPASGWTQTSSTYTPTAGPGVYEFRARLRKSATGAASGYSPAVSMTVS
ncbi:MAG: FG-GAP-like repeat-containing protein [Actinomycetota bacterium]